MIAALSGIAGQGIREKGGPEALATGTEVGLNLLEPLKNLANIFKKTPVTKPSGLSERKFEGITKPTKVSEKMLRTATEGIEREYRSIVSDLLEDTNKSYSAMLEDPAFKTKISNMFGTVEKSAKELAEPVSPVRLMTSINEEINEIGKKGLTLSETEKVKNTELRRFLKSANRQEVTAEQLLDQYRKNNESLSKIFPYGENAAQNAGKREALEAYNRSIAKTIEDNFADTKFGELFKFTNKRWSEIKRVETVDKFLDALFKGDKIHFANAEKAISDPKKSAVLKNALGNEAFADFKQLNQDLLSQQNAFKLLKAKNVNIDDLSKATLSYILKPAFAKAKVGAGLVQNLYRKTLSDPKMIRDWRKGLELIKKGDVNKGLLIFNSLASQSQES